MDCFGSVDSDETNRFLSPGNAHGQCVAVVDSCDNTDNATTRIWRDAGGRARYEGETNANDDRSYSARRSALLYLDALDESAGTEATTTAH